MCPSTAERGSLAWVGVRLLLTGSGPVMCGLVGPPVLLAITTLSIGHVLGYALMYGLSLRAAKTSDDQHRRTRGEQ